MRESRVFGERRRTRKSDIPAKKYFLVFEGSETEPLYFEALNNARQTLGISSLIQFIPLERCRGEEGWSNPRLILDTLSGNLAERDGSSLTYSTLLNAMIDCLYTSEYVRKRGNIITEIWDTLRTHCEDNLGHSLSDIVKNQDKAVAEMLEAIKESRPRIYNLILDNLKESIQALQITYVEEIDRLCFIFDRDRNSFTRDQYSDVIDICNEKKISAYPSNPCFEFWLLLHFDEVHSLDQEKLIANRKISESRHANTYTVHHVKKLMGRYKKSKYDAHILMERIPTATKNAKQYCEEVLDLENQLGSAVGLLITEILQVQ